MITGFDSFREYAQFALAKGFKNRRTKDVYSNREHPWERCGDILVRPVLGGMNLSLQNIRNPPVISALALVAISVATAFFYPERIPNLPFLTGGNLRFGFYSTAVVTIVGLALRTLGRLQGKLFEEWQLRDLNGRRGLKPIPIGATFDSKI